MKENELMDLKCNDYYIFWIKKNGISFLYDLESDDKKGFIKNDSEFKEALLNRFDNRNIGNIGVYLITNFGANFLLIFFKEMKYYFDLYKVTGIIPDGLK